MEKLEEIYQVFYEHFFEKSEVLSSNTFNAIFTNGYEIYFIKYIEELKSAEEIWGYENEIFDYQNEIAMNSTDLAYNLNFVIVSKYLDLKTRRILEQDKYTSKKIIINIDSCKEDMELFPFNKKKFTQSNSNDDLDNLVLEKLKKIVEAEPIIMLLNKEKIVEKDINNILNLVRGDKV
ncbi:hypothetical protein CN922_21875 [Bacillus cereus]|uniref:hypothetical protein n=1 Tax=Bacillus cereus TaxID=1396 RepID=UPI000BFDE50A|nr:hypothetical protein [Bacillus cereus]PGL47814.1 hypothetical protein CN922_21875 [Bacillus cereus]